MICKKCFGEGLDSLRNICSNCTGTGKIMEEEAQIEQHEEVTEETAEVVDEESFLEESGEESVDTPDVEEETE